MSTSGKHPVKTSALLLALAFGLTACGGGDKAPAGGNEAKPTAQAGELAEKQEIVINNGAEPESLDPHKVSGVPESGILRQLLVGLTTTDADGNIPNEPVITEASSVSMSPKRFSVTNTSKLFGH